MHRFDSAGFARALGQFGWVAAFLAVLAALLLPLILVSAHLGREVSIIEQAAIVAVATLAVQRMRRRPFAEVTGRLDLRWLRQLGIGAGLGALLMAAPAALLAAGGWVAFRWSGAGAPALLDAVMVMAAVALAEELLFRGVLFQRLIDGIGIWPAQLVIAALFVLTHIDNPGMEGATRIWAGVNIALASIMFGLCYLRTRGLALAIGLHFMANVTQGVILGFGVSGNEMPTILAPVFAPAGTWLTGGAFGLEASLPGLVAVAGMIALLARARFLLEASPPRSGGGA